MNTIRIYTPEGEAARTDRVDASDIASHIAGGSSLSFEAELLQEFSDSDDAPQALADGRYVLKTAGGEPYCYTYIEAS